MEIRHQELGGIRLQMKRMSKVSAAALLSLIWPGLGQIWARRWRRGLLYLGLSLALALVVRSLTRLAAPTQESVILFAGLIALAIALHIYAAGETIWLMVRHPNETKPRWPQSTWLAFLANIAISVAISFVLPFGWRAFSIPTSSMDPTLKLGDRFLIDIREPSRYERADIVAFTLKRNPNASYVKRVVALPGERVEMRNGALYINGAEARRLPMREPDHEVETLPQGRSYEIIKEQKNGLIDAAGPFEVPPDHLFVLGDNRGNSMDSRISEQDGGMGYVPVESLIGRAGVIYWSHKRDRILNEVR